MSPARVVPLSVLAGRLPRLCTVQPKLDGVRAMAQLDHGRVSIRTRSGREVITLPHLVDDLRGVLVPGIAYDGELYAVGMGFSRIQTAVAWGGADASAICLHVFDAAGRSARGGHARRLSLVHQSERVRLVATSMMGESGARSLAQSLIDQGEEGAVIRPALSGYGKAWKVKPADDSEYRIVAAERSQEGLRFTCDANGRPFAMVCPGLEPTCSLIGQWLTVRHSGVTEHGVPRHAVAMRVRLEA